jgi:cytochrome c553
MEFKGETATMKRHAKAGMLTVILAMGAMGTMGISSAARAQTPAGDAAAGAKKISMCIGCHGIEGYKTAFPEVYNVPRIGGQHAAYIVKALQAYKSGERNHPSMKGIAATLSDKDMADLAAYYAAGATHK